MCNCYHKTLLVLCTHNVFVSSVFSEQQVAEFYSSVSPKQTQQKNAKKSINIHTMQSHFIQLDIRNFANWLLIYHISFPCLCQLVTDLLQNCYGEATGKLA